MGKTKQKGNGEGTIYKSSRTGLYIGQYVTNGKRHSIYQKKNEKIGDFKKRFNDILSSINNNTYIEKTTETLYQILVNYINQKHNDGITSDVTFLKDKQLLKEVEKTCKGFIYKPIQKITVEDIEKDKKFIREYSQSIVDKLWGLIRKGFKIAYSRRKISFNIMEDETLVKPISIKKPEKIQALDSKELKKLNLILDTKERNHKYRNIIKLQLETGMRIGETLARSVKDFDLRNKKMLVHNTLTKDEKGNILLGKHTKTYNKRTGLDSGVRELFINNVIEEIIKEQIQSKITNVYGLIFWDYKNNSFISYNEINSYLKRLNDKYKITSRHLSTHVLRHTKITEMRKAGMDMKAIQYLVGHVSGSSVTENVYTDLTKDFLKQELKKIN